MNVYLGAKCKKCGADIRFIRTKNGKNMPVDDKLVTIITEQGKIFKGYVPHFVTCPYANEFRKKNPASTMNRLPEKK